jgi:diacylglycerol kinase family enzyme
MRIAALINDHAGSVKAYGGERLEQEMRDKLGSQLGPLHRGTGESVIAASQQMMADKPDVLLIAGGDGTARCMAELAMTSNIPLVFLPGGTMNVLPKKLGAMGTLGEAVDAVAEGRLRLRRLDIGMANERPFFVAVAFGFLPHMTQWREEFRTIDRSTRVGWTWRQIRALGGQLFAPTVRLLIDNYRPLFPSPGVLISVGDADTLAPGRDPAAQLAGLEIVLLNANNWLELAGVLSTALFSAKWREHKDIDTFQAQQVLVQRRRRRYIRLTLDGEPTRLQGPITVRYVKDALPVYALLPASEGRVV